MQPVKVDFRRFEEHPSVTPSSHPRHPCPYFRALVLAVTVLGVVAPPPAGAQDPAAERLFGEARRLEQAGDQDAALGELELLVQQFPNDALAPRALLSTAQLRRARGEVDVARTTLAKLFEHYPRTEEAAAGFVLEADMLVEGARSSQDLEEARQRYRRVPLLYGPERYPSLGERLRARLAAAELAIDLDDSEGAAAELVSAIEEEPSSPWRARARLLLAETWIRSGDWKAATDHLLELTRDPETATGDGAVVTEPDRAAARRWLTLLHRHRVRPEAGGSVWTSVSRYPTGATLREPSGVAAGEDGRLLVVDGKADTVLLLGDHGTVVDRAVVDGGGRPGWSEGRWPFVVTDREIVLPFHGQRTNFLEPRPDREIPLKGMQAAARGRFGDWFVLAKGFKGLLAFESRRKGSELLVASRLEIEDVTHDAIGRILVLDSRANQVGRLSHDRRWEGALISGAWRKPTAIATDPLGNLYVLDRGTATIEVFDAAGRRWTTVGPVVGSGIELRSPVDLAVDGSGRLAIADSKLPFIVVMD